MSNIPSIVLFSFFFASITYNVTFHLKGYLPILPSSQESQVDALCFGVARMGQEIDPTPKKDTFKEIDSQSAPDFFQNEIEVVELLGSGDVSYGFKAIYKNETIVVKMATDGDLYFSDLEIDFFSILNAPPTIASIPKMHFAIRSMMNPYFGASESTRNHLIKIGLEDDDVEDLVAKRRISLMGIDMLTGKREASSLDEVRHLVKSLLETMQFVHSRNIIHADLHDLNYFWDGETAHFFDWNAAFLYEPNKVPIHYRRAPTHLFPPEAQNNESAVHTSVYAFDVYTIGRQLKRKLKSCCNITPKYLDRAAQEIKMEGNTTDKGKANLLLEEFLAYELAMFMMLPDPYQRPNTTSALQHPFFGGDLTPDRHKLSLEVH